jgi:hypothetical protein
MHKKHILVLFKTLILSGFILFNYGCPMKEAYIYIYSDGSGNSYHISGKNDRIIEYRPVEPASSSSGYYSGGSYLKIKVNSNQYNDIISSINKAVLNQSIHIKDRVMMSGLISIKKDKKEEIYILKPGSSEKEILERTIKDALFK